VAVSPTYLAAPGPLAFAHRGGAGTGTNVGIENTMASFSDAVGRGYTYLETDVRCSADGTVFTLHDETLLRVTGNPARVADLTDAQLAEERLDGREPPARLQDVYEAFPHARLNIDVKTRGAVEATCALIERLGVVDRTCLASFDHATLRAIRRRLPAVTTSASSLEVAELVLRPTTALRRLGVIRADCLQVPVRRGRVTVVTPRFLAKAHRLGLQVHVWTIDDADEMNRLLDLGVDGLITDRTDILREVMEARGTWKDNA